MLQQKPLKFVKGIGEKKAQLFQKKLGLFSLSDLLQFYPRDYQDWSAPLKICNAPTGQPVCLRAKIESAIEKSRTFKRGIETYSFTIYDRTGTVKVVLFNNKYLAEQLTVGGTYLFYGKLKWNGVIRELDSPEIRPEDYCKIRPIYHATKGLTSRMIENIMQNAVALLKPENDPLPEQVRQQYHLLPQWQALRAIHFPKDFNELEQARTRLCFEEIFLLHAGMCLLKNRNRAATATPIQPLPKAAWQSLLPFALTPGQQAAVNDCLKDMQQTTPMNRLIQGDVGCGKTAVAAVLCYHTVQSGCGCVLLAPTELLARQHAESLNALFGKVGVTVQLLVSAMPAAEKRAVLAKLAKGTPQITVATHAVLTEKVQLPNIGLIITDEQHRFGVEQRTSLSKKANFPHTLVMSATPIPRTLGLTVYGDLSISRITQLPGGRQPIESYCVPPELRPRALNYIKKHLNAGLQGYIVCPAIEEDEESETPGLMAAKTYYEQLSSGALAGYRLGLLHAKLKPAEKQAVMADFAAGKIQLLVATTVIEVGVNVPNAAIMIIENAERFGLSQLHQLRGRVGRGAAKSTCIFICGGGEKARTRMQILCKSNNGFEIAEEDLKLRGPGNFLGKNQHGLPNLKLADLITDAELIQNACNAATNTLQSDPLLQAEMHKNMNICIKNLFFSNNSVDLN